MSRSKHSKSAKSQNGSRKNGSRAAKQNAPPKATISKSQKKARRKQLKKQQSQQVQQTKQPEQPKQPKQPNLVHHRDHLKAFFEKYPSFNYDSSVSVMDEFYRMCDHFDWERDGKERKKAHNKFKDALVQEFNNIYGTDHNDLAAWQSLCRVLNLENIPNELEVCRQLVKSMHVNIVDLVDTRATRAPVTHFSSEVALSNYTISTGKYFPKESAYAGGLLKYLLRRIENPGSHPRRR